MAIEVCRNLDTINAIDNGNFDVWQRTPNTFTNVLSSTRLFKADRFHTTIDGNTGSFNGGIDTSVPPVSEGAAGATYSLKTENNMARTLTGTDHVGLYHRVEGNTLRSVMYDSMVLSFWCKTSNPGKYYVSFRNYNGTRSYVAPFTIALADTWQKFEVAVPIINGMSSGTWYTDENQGLIITWCLSVGDTFKTASVETWVSENKIAGTDTHNFMSSVGNDFYLAQVKLEPGDTATPFVPRNVGDEVRRCKRYYDKIYGTHEMFMASTIYLHGFIPFMVKKRATPTINFPSGSSNMYYAGPWTNNTATTCDRALTTGMHVKITNSSGTFPTMRSYIVVLTAEIEVDF
jgi:hypothetical protein